MKLVEMTDYGNAKEVFVDGLGSVDFLGGTVQTQYFTRWGEERRLILCLRWELGAWLAGLRALSAIREEAYAASCKWPAIVEYASREAH